MSTAGEARGTKRARQACENCRRKKARCPGERPVCSFCSRLGQKCLYDDELQAQITPGSDLHQANVGDLVARISTLESTLRGLSPTAQASIHAPTVHHNTPNAPYPSTSISNVLPSTRLDLQKSVDRLSPNGSGIFAFDISCEGLPEAVVHSLIDDFFAFSHNQLYSFFHEGNFRGRHAEGLLPNFLLCAVLTTALRFSDNPFFAGKKKLAAGALALESWRSIVSQYIDGDADCSIEAIQTTTLLAIYDFIEGRQNKAWVKLGFAARFAQQLRLTDEPPAFLSYSSREEYRRTFWSVYLLDRLITCGRSRPPAFIDYCCAVHLPCSEGSFRSNQWESTEQLSRYTSGQLLQSGKPAPFARVIIMASALGRCSQYAIQAYNVGVDVPPWDTRSDFAAIHSTLQYLEAQLGLQQSLHEALSKYSISDDELHRDSAEPLVISYILYHLCHCLLQHFYLLRRRMASVALEVPQSFLVRSLDTGRNHAVALNRVLREASEIGCMVKASFVGYCCLIAATIHAVYQFSDDANLRYESQGELQFALDFLKRHSIYWPNSISMRKSLTDFCQKASAYKDLINVFTRPVKVDDKENETLSSITDYSTLSNTTDAAVWPLLGQGDTSSRVLGFDLSGHGRLTDASNNTQESTYAVDPIASSTVVGSGGLNLNQEINMQGWDFSQFP